MIVPRIICQKCNKDVEQAGRYLDLNISRFVQWTKCHGKMEIRVRATPDLFYDDTAFNKEHEPK